ncbi:MAG: phosphoribosylglycinamide formyltransferase [Saprospiraceae bacterium]
MKNIAIFATGGGSNAQKIIEHFENHDAAKVSLVISNKKTAGVLERAAVKNIPTLIINREEFYQTENIIQKLDAFQIDFIVLAGFLWLMPTYIVKSYAKKVINIHPAILPKYGGKGMYGMNVHRAVHAAQEVESGMTIHYVNEEYDEGAIIFQAKCSLQPTDSPEDIAKKVLQLEHQHYPQVIENLILEI